MVYAWYIRPIRFENSIRNRIGWPIRFEIRFERKKTIRRSLNLLKKCVSAHPQDTKCTHSQSKSRFLGQFLLRGFDFEVDLDSV